MNSEYLRDSLVPAKIEMTNGVSECWVESGTSHNVRRSVGDEEAAEWTVESMLI